MESCCFHGKEIKPLSLAPRVAHFGNGYQAKTINVFISSTWTERKHCVAEIATKLDSFEPELEGKSISVWRQENAPTDHVTDELAEAIQSCHLFLAFVNEAYQRDSKICQCQLLYALQLQKNLVFVKMNHLSHGWLDVLMTGEVVVQFPPDRSVDMAFHDIIVGMAGIFMKPLKILKLSRFLYPGVDRYDALSKPKARKSPTARIESALHSVPYGLRLSLYSFLFFEAEESISLFDLATILGYNNSPLDMTRRLIDTLNRTIECVTYNEAKDRAVLQLIFYKAALKRATSDWKLVGNNEECLEQLRFRLVLGLACVAKDRSQSVNDDHFVFSTIKQGHRLLLEHAVYKVAACHLAELCCLKANSNGMSLLHFLYHFIWPDDIVEFYGECDKRRGPRYSYRVISKILLKLRQADIDLCQPIPLTTRNEHESFNILTEPSPTGSSFLLDLLKDEERQVCYFERLTILEVIAPWRNCYLEEQWKQHQVRRHSVSMSLVSAVKGDMANFKIFCSDADAEATESLEETLLAAARCGNLPIFAHLHVTMDKVAASQARDENGNNALMLAAKNGHHDIVNLIVSQDPAGVLDGNNCGQTAVMLAAENGHVDTIKALANENEAFTKAVTLRDLNGKTALLAAVANGCLPVVQYFFETFHNLKSLGSQTDKLGLSGLTLAAKNGHFDVFDFVYRRLSAIKGTRYEKLKALTLAAGNGHLRIVEYMQTLHPHYVQVPDKHGQLALTEAASGGHLDVVRFLCKTCEDSIRLKDSTGKAGLMAAAAKGEVEVVKFLYEKCAFTIKWADNRRRTPLNLAAAEGHIATVMFLYPKFSEALRIVDMFGNTPMMSAAANGHISIVKLFYELNPEGAKLRNSTLQSCLMLAAKSGCLEVVQYLFDVCPVSLSYVDINGRSALMLAALEGKCETVEFLCGLSHDAQQRDRFGCTAFMLAIQSGSVDTVKVLFDMMDTDEIMKLRDSQGQTVLLLAAATGSIQTIRFLLDQCPEAGIRVSDNKGRSALMVAAANGHAQAVEYLHNIDPSAIKIGDRDGRTALAHAACSGHLAITQFLYTKFRDAVMFCDVDDRTPLMSAAACGFLDIVTFLQPHYKFAINIRDKLGRTAADLAKASGHSDVTAFLNKKANENANSLFESLSL